MRVLIVSEHADERARAGSMLRHRAEVEVVEADTAVTAKQLLVDEAYDALVIDGDLSPQGGFSFLYEFHLHAEQHGFAVPPAIVLTARPEDRWLADWAHAATTVTKPVDPFVLARTVDDLTATAAA